VAYASLSAEARTCATCFERLERAVETVSPLAAKREIDAAAELAADGARPSEALLGGCGPPRIGLPELRGWAAEWPCRR